MSLEQLRDSSTTSTTESSTASCRARPPDPGLRGTGADRSDPERRPARWPTTSGAQPRVRRVRRGTAPPAEDAPKDRHPRGRRTSPDGIRAGQAGARGALYGDVPRAAQVALAITLAEGAMREAMAQCRGHSCCFFSSSSSAAVVAAFARRIPVPAPSLLVVAGLLVGLLPGVPAVQVTPEVVSLVVLPPLLYAAGEELPWRDLRAVWRPVIDPGGRPGAGVGGRGRRRGRRRWRRCRRAWRSCSARCWPAPTRSRSRALGRRLVAAAAAAGAGPGREPVQRRDQPGAVPRSRCRRGRRRRGRPGRAHGARVRGAGGRRRAGRRRGRGRGRRWSAGAPRTRCWRP